MEVKQRISTAVRSGCPRRETQCLELTLSDTCSVTEFLIHLRCLCDEVGESFYPNSSIVSDMFLQ